MGIGGQAMRACGAALEPKSLLCVVVGLAMAACLESKPGGTGVVLDLGDGLQQGPSSASEVAEKVDTDATRARDAVIAMDLKGLGEMRLPGEDTVVTPHNCTKLYAFRYDGTCVSQCPPNMEPDGPDSICVCDAAHAYMDLNVPMNNVGGRSFEACVAVCPGGEAPIGGNGTDAAHCRKCAEPRSYSANNTCVSVCPGGSAPNSNNACFSCIEQTSGEQPYADHTSHKCVASCPAGKAPRGGKYESWDTRERDPAATDCVECPEGEFADHDAHRCVPECPTGSIEQEDSGDCVPDVDRSLGEAPKQKTL